MGLVMKRNVLLSLHSPYDVAIVKGRKTIELRKRFPLFEKKDRIKIFIYACSPISKIIGECDLKEVKKMSLKQLWKITRKLAIVDKYDFQKYLKNTDYGFALYLKNSLEYKKPIPLKRLDINWPPRSYRYISNEIVIKLFHLKKKRI